MSIQNNSNYDSVQSFEIIVIEDNKLINMILSKTLDSTINRIRNLKKVPVKFSSFRKGTDLLDYLKTKSFYNSKLLVFSDYYLEGEENGAEVIQYIKENDIDATIIVMSDFATKNASGDPLEVKSNRFLPKGRTVPNIYAKVINQALN
ncbi:MAG: response regulator [Draconibacterium sp.]